MSILDSDLIVNCKDFPNAVKGDIAEIYHADSKQNKLLLQFMTFKDDAKSRGKFFLSIYLIMYLHIIGIV